MALASVAPREAIEPGAAMTFWMGSILIALTVAMIVAARPKDGISAPFLKSWFVGQLYTLTALVSAVMGVTIVISYRPF
jgi:hypothetical protein